MWCISKLNIFLFRVKSKHWRFSYIHLSDMIVITTLSRYARKCHERRASSTYMTFVRLRDSLSTNFSILFSWFYSACNHFAHGWSNNTFSARMVRLWQRKCLYYWSDFSYKYTGIRNSTKFNFALCKDESFKVWRGLPLITIQSRVRDLSKRLNHIWCKLQLSDHLAFLWNGGRSRASSPTSLVW